MTTSAIAADLRQAQVPAAARPMLQSWLMIAGLLLAIVIIHGIIQAGLPTLDKALLAELGVSRGAL
jgi:hypothetical protein